MNYETRSLGELLSAIASSAVTPAGGTAGAVVGAIGVALCEMVCIHLREGDVATDVDLERIQADLHSRRKRMLLLGEADAAVVEALFGPAADGTEQSAIRQSVGVPLALAETCQETLVTATSVTEAEDRPVLVDAGTGAYFIRSALDSALFTARYNLGSSDDEPFSEETERWMSELEASAEHEFQQVLSNLDGNADS